MSGDDAADKTLES